MCLNQHVEFCQKTVMAEKGVGCSSQHIGVGPLLLQESNHDHVSSPASTIFS